VHDSIAVALELGARDRWFFVEGRPRESAECAAYGARCASSAKHVGVMLETWNVLSLTGCSESSSFASSCFSGKRPCLDAASRRVSAMPQSGMSRGLAVSANYHRFLPDSARASKQHQGNHREYRQNLDCLAAYPLL